MTEQKSKYRNEAGQDITDLVMHQARLDEIRKKYPMVQKLEDYISRKDEEARTSDSKVGSKKAADLAWRAGALKHRFEELMEYDLLPSSRQILMNRGRYPAWNLNENDPLAIKLRELREFFIKKFDYFIGNNTYLSGGANLLEEEKKQRELLIEYIREEQARPNYGLFKMKELEDNWDHGAGLFHRHIHALCDARGRLIYNPDSFRREQLELERLSPHEKFPGDCSTFLKIYGSFRNTISNKVVERQLTGNQYNYLVHTPTEQLFHEVLEEVGGLFLRSNQCLENGLSCLFYTP